MQSPPDLSHVAGNGTICVAAELVQQWATRVAEPPDVATGCGGLQGMTIMFPSRR